MQKVIRRTILAEKQAVRRAAKRSEKKQRDKLKTTLEQQGFHRRQEVALIKAARIARREDWELGPLAPKRDAGEKKLTYGTIDTMRTKGPLLSKRQQKEQREYIGGKFRTIVQGDRVVITQGRDQGKIGQIVAMDHERGECKIAGLNMVCLLFTKPSCPICFGTIAKNLPDGYQNPRIYVIQLTRARQAPHSLRRATSSIHLDSPRHKAQKRRNGPPRGRHLRETRDDRTYV